MKGRVGGLLTNRVAEISTLINSRNWKKSYDHNKYKEIEYVEHDHHRLNSCLYPRGIILTIQDANRRTVASLYFANYRRIQFHSNCPPTSDDKFASDGR